MSLNKILEKIQNQTPQTKGKILAVIVVLAGLGLGTLWINDIQNNWAGLDTDDIIPQNGSVLSAVNYITVESIENRDGKTNLYFKVENNTSDILNFPKQDKITLKMDNKVINPESILSRQQQPFVIKVLSNTTLYGYLTFPELTEDEGELNFDDLFFEQSQNTLFKQSIEIDLDNLKTLEELRS